MDRRPIVLVTGRKGEMPSGDTLPVSVLPPGIALPVGAVIVSAAFTLPSGWILCDGSSVSRTLYSALFSAITSARTGNTTSGSAVVTGLSDSDDLYIGCPVEGSGITAGTTIASIDSSTQITLSANATATGSPVLRFLPWGAGDGSTTFTIPDFRDRFLTGAHASTDHRQGQTGGTASHNLSHTHTVVLPTAIGVEDGGVLAAAEVPASGTYTTSSSLTTIDNRPPFVGVIFLIKT